VKDVTLLKLVVLLVTRVKLVIHAKLAIHAKAVMVVWAVIVVHSVNIVQVNMPLVAKRLVLVDAMADKVFVNNNKKPLLFKVEVKCF
jgi:hypothetical protein